MIKQRLINCDFLNASGFRTKLSNKAKLLYFCYITNADDRGFVGNVEELVESLDRCEENFENTLFTYKYVDAMKELVDRRLVFEFVDSVGNKTHLIRHWFYHNKYMPKLQTNFISYLAQVELVDNKYQLKTIQKENPYKGKKIKENEIKVNKSHYDNKKDLLDSNNTTVEKEKEKADWEKDWDYFLKDIETVGKEN